ncbi:MAG: PilN domain-containing protein [Bacteroidetes bacterium]|nr:PilN domain-containing protein [Bacteroidota bacterium]
MIKINLLADKKGKKKEPKQPAASKFLVYVLAAAVASILIGGGFTYYLSYSKEQLKKQIESNKNLVGQLQQKIQDVKKFEALNASFEQKAGLIENLRRNQAVPVRILDEVSAVLPEGVWLSSLLYKDDKVVIEGFAFTNLDIVSYIDNFKKSEIISDVFLDESKFEEIDKVQTYKFKLHFKVKS